MASRMAFSERWKIVVAGASRSASLYSSSISPMRWAASRPADMWEIMSPSTWFGTRTFFLMILRISSLILPADMYLEGGSWRPSS